MKKAMRLVAMLLACAMMFTACSSAPASSETTGGETTETTEKVLNLVRADTPATLNPHTAETDYEILLDLSASMYRTVWDVENGVRTYVPALAVGDPVPADETNKVWTITIDEGYTFMDGTPIDANTIEYSIKMSADPKLANRNAGVTSIENGVKYIAGECEWSEVGFKAIDDHTIQITYADDFEPATVMDVKEEWAYVGNAVVHKDTYEACMSEDGMSCTYGSSLDTFVASGLYYPSDLIEGQYFEYTRRTDTDKLVNSDIFTPDKVTYTAVSDSNAQVQLFEQGKIDAVVANQAQYDEYPGAKYQLRADNMGYYINGETPSHPILTDPNMRYALYWATDRQQVIDMVFPTSVASPYQYHIQSKVPMEDGVLIDYRSTPEAQAIKIDGHALTETGYDPELALDYFEKAYAPYEGEKITVTAIYADTSDINKEYAEVLQAQIQKVIPADKFEIVLQATPGATIYDTIARTNMDFDICFGCGDYCSVEAPWEDTNWVYSGPYTYNTQYCSIASQAYRDEYDKLAYGCMLYEAKNDPQLRLEYTARMEEIRLNDCCFIPVYNRAYRWFFSDKITPVMEQGHVDLEFMLMQATFN